MDTGVPRRTCRKTYIFRNMFLNTNHKYMFLDHMFVILEHIYRFLEYKFMFRGIQTCDLENASLYSGNHMFTSWDHPHTFFET